MVSAFAEIDPQFAGAKVIMADKADGAALPAREQPFWILAADEKMLPDPCIHQSNSKWSGCGHEPRPHFAHRGKLT